MRIIYLILALAISGCASSVKLAPKESDVQMKEFAVPEQQALVYVVQTGGFLTTHRINFQVLSNGEFVSGMSGYTYTVFDVEPGENSVQIISPENQEYLSYEARKGEITYIGVGSKGGWTQMRVKDLRVLDEEEGRHAVRKAKLAASVKELKGSD